MRRFLFILKFAWPYLKQYRFRFFTGLVFAILCGPANALFIWQTKTIVSRLSSAAGTSFQSKAFAVWESSVNFSDQILHWLDPWMPLFGRSLDWRQVVGGILIVVLPVLLRSAFSYLSGYCLSWVTERVINDIRADVFGKINTLSLDFFNRTTMGDLVTRINGDAATIQTGLRGGFLDIVKEPITLLSLFIGLCIVDWQLTSVAAVFLIVCLRPIQVLGRKARKAGIAGGQASITQYSQILESLSGIRIVKAFGLEKEQLDQFRQHSRKMIHSAMKSAQANQMINPTIEVIATFGLGILVVWIVGTQRHLSDVLAYLTGVMMMQPSLKRIGGLHLTFEGAGFSVERLIGIFNEQPTVKENSSPKHLEHFNTDIRFEHTSFAYVDRIVLNNIDLVVPRGFKLGIAGESGSGKSTLANLLFRFYDPTHGRILLDGVDLRELAINDLRQLMALVSQEIVLFDKTVAENIACGRPCATRAEVEQAARQAYAHEFIMQLPQGYDTRIGERGVTLSGGQRQRLSIARAFVRNAPILVLDEATAALDSQAEAEVQAAIDHLAENRTVISIAHRLSTLRTSDRIIVLTQGRIVETGDFQELLAKGGVFADMARRQGINPSA